MMLQTQFNNLWVACSIFVAIFASYVAMNIAQSVIESAGKVRAVWLLFGSVAMGLGIWSMHFIGMLAFEVPGMNMAYDVFLVVISVIVAVAASACSLFVVSRPKVTIVSIFFGGVFMAAAIAGMHYIGMAAMRMPARIVWDVPLVVLSIFIALVAAFGALFIFTRAQDALGDVQRPLMASTIMGFAIAGMHYTGMYAASYVRAENLDVPSAKILVTSSLTISVIIGTLSVLAIALFSSLGLRLWDRRMKVVDADLGKSEERFRRLVEAVKDYAIYMLDTEGRITTWNVGAERISGYPEKEILGKPVSTFYTQRDIDENTASRELSLAKATGHFECEGQRVRKDGKTYWASIVITPLYNSDMNLIGFSKVTRDITRAKEAEMKMQRLNEELEERVLMRTHALEQRESQLRTVTDAVPVLIAQINLQQEILFANEAFLNWFQLSELKPGRKTFREILGPERYPSNEAHLMKAFSGETVVYEREASSGDTRSVLSVTLVPEKNSAGLVIGVVIVATDITKHKEIQAELNSAKEAAEVANVTKSAFLANMSHEIRTPLGVVLGFSELLVNDEMSVSDRKDSLEIIKRNGLLLSNIINDILDLSKVEAGRLEIERVPVAFEDIMKEFSSVLDLEASGKGIQLLVSSSETIPSKLVTDPLRLRQILFNIVGNAIKFTNRGSVSVQVKLVQDSEGSTKLAFVVTDTGEGIPAEQVSRLFKPFVQADVSTTRKFGGTGLGLVLSKKLANALGGDLVLTDTTPGKGSTFTITVDPGSEVQPKPDTIDGAVPKSWKGNQWQTEISLAKMKILLVEDSVDNQILITKLLRLSGATVDTADNGRLGVQKAQSGDYHVILMDLQMPEMDGYAATKELRDLGYNRPIIALTAHAMKEERERSLRHGFNCHLTKPVDHVELVRTLSAYL